MRVLSVFVAIILMAGTLEAHRGGGGGFHGGGGGVRGGGGVPGGGVCEGGCRGGGRSPGGRISWRGTSCETRFRRASWFRRPSRFWSEALCRPGISARFPFVYCVRTSFPSGFQDVWIIGRDFAVLRFSFLSLCSCRTALFTTDLLSADLYSTGPDTDDERLPEHQ